MHVHLFWVISSNGNEISNREKNDILGGRLILGENPVG
jgi:hypothetical protein